MRFPPQSFARTLLATSVVLFCSVVAGQTQNVNPPQTGAPSSSGTLPTTEHQRGKLELGKPIERELKGGESDVYTIKLKKGQFLHVVAEQKGIDVVVTLVGPDGKKIVEADSPNGAWGPEPASLIAGASGVFQIRVESPDENARAGKYEVKVTVRRRLAAGDETRIAAERSLFEAAQLGAQNNLSAAKKSLGIYEQALSLWQKIGDPYEQALILTAIGQIEDSVGSKRRAIDAFSQALPLYQALGDHPGELYVLSAIGGAHTDLGENKKALEYLNLALPLSQAASDRTVEGTILNNIGRVYDNTGEGQKALEYYDRALVIKRNTKDVAGQAAVLSNLGRVNRRLGEMQKALDYYGESLPLQRASGSRRGEGVTLNNMGVVYKDLGELQKALEYYNQALPIRREIGDRYGEIATLNNIGTVYWAKGENQKALDYFLPALAIAQAGGFRTDEGNALDNIGTAYGRLDQKEKALDYYNKALPIRREVGDRSGEAQTLNSIAVLLWELHDLKKALDFFNQTLAIRQAIGDRSGQATALNNIAIVLRDLGDTQTALDYCNQALPLRRAVGDRSGEAVTLTSLGILSDDLGERQKAADYFQQALPLERGVGDRTQEASTLTNLAKVDDKLGEKREALNNYLQALALAHALKSPMQEGAILDGLMDHWRDAKNLPLAIFAGKQAVNSYQQIRANIRGMEKNLQKSFLESKASTYRELADLLIEEGRLPEAEEVLNLLKEEEYFEFIRRDGRMADALTKPVALTPAEAKTYGEYEKIADQVTTIDREWSELRTKAPLTPEEEAHIGELAEKLKLANEAMELYFRGLNTEFAQGDPSKKRDIEELREKTSGLQSLVGELGPGTVALYTLVTETRYRVIVITPSAMQAREYDIERADLRRKVAALRTALTDPKSDPLPASQELYKIVMGPIEKDLHGAKAKTLMWGLDDVLRYVPIAALHDGKHYVIENYRNVVFTTASLGHLKDQPDLKNWRGLGMGVSKDYDGLGALPQVPEELKGIIHDENVQGSNGVIPGTMMLDDTFTEKNMGVALEKHSRLVHIASHFVLQPGDDTASYLLLGGKEEGGKGYHLTLAELRTDPRLSFSDTDLLTLSACQTATSGSAADGHEVDGLGIMAQQRGAKAVIATLWSVDDESTGLLMADFYARWIDHPEMSKGEALRQAQIAMLHGKQTASRHPSEPHAQGQPNSQAVFVHPYFWAPFILIGNWK